MLVMWLLEGITVALDQWMGHRADPTSDVATLGGVYLFSALAVIGIAPVVAFFRHIRGRRPAAKPSGSPVGFPPPRRACCPQVRAQP
jgi:hypothetical protein